MTPKAELCVFAALGALACAPPALARQEAVNTIQMSQVGFETHGPKIATVVDASRTPLPWRVTEAAGTVVARGMSSVFGDDAASGAHVHIVSFATVETPGDAYRLTVGDHISRPFVVTDHPLARLKIDALAFFYQNRAGVPIMADHVARPDLARAAGHPHETATCFSGPDEAGTIWHGCDYSLDVTGGWYDAGDHGKYVVNGGSSVWMLLNAWERAQAKGGIGASVYPDGTATSPKPETASTICWTKPAMRSNSCRGCRSRKASGPKSRSAPRSRAVR